GRAVRLQELRERQPAGVVVAGVESGRRPVARGGGADRVDIASQQLGAGGRGVRFIPRRLGRSREDRSLYWRPDSDAGAVHGWLPRKRQHRWIDLSIAER